jgi:hypothetical protein
MLPTTHDDWQEAKGTSDAIVRFEQPGTVLEGIFLGGQPAGDKRNQLYSLKSNGQIVKFWETFVLKDKLEEVPRGHSVRIEYTGLSGKTKTFSVRHKPARRQDSVTKEP